MSAKLHLITGATGATGGEAIASLLAAGERVRAMAHRRDERSERLAALGVDVVYGSFGRFGDLQAALKGVSSAYFCYPLSPGIVEATALFAQAAKDAGVRVIANMSQVIARKEAASHASFAHWMSERVFDWSGVPTVHLRPGFFAEWLIYLSPMIREGTVYTPYGQGKAALISAEDQGRVIAAILRDPAAHVGKTYPLLGPVEMTFPEIIAETSRVLGPPVRHQQVPFEMMIKAFSAQRAAVARNDSFTSYAETNVPDDKGESFQSQHLRAAAEDHHNGLFSGVNDIVERITGRKPLTIAQYVEARRQYFVP